MLFRFIVIISVNIFILMQCTHAQVDTTELKLIVSQLKSSEDHINFWQYLYDRDQTYRNVKTSKINDLENLISASFYLNKFGYPSEDIKAGKILPFIWIHNSYPLVKQVSFPLIFFAWKNKQISETDLRTYYLRNMYWKKYFDQENRTKALSVLFAELNLNIEDKINIHEIIVAFKESENFLNQSFVTIGHWNNPKGDSTVKILKSDDGEYYYHNLYVDGSYYPQKVIQDEKHPSLFRNYFDPDQYFGIQPNGDLIVKYLTVKNNFEKKTMSPIEIEK